MLYLRLVVVVLLYSVLSKFARDVVIPDGEGSKLYSLDDQLNMLDAMHLKRSRYRNA